VLPPDPQKLETVYSEYKADALADSQSQEHPVAIITGGQPGSGKSRLAFAASKELQDHGGRLLVDADELREAHPSYSAIDDKEAAKQTHEVAAAWAWRLVNDGVAERRNLVIDQTSKTPDKMDELTVLLRKAGYRIELRVMAINPLVSEQRTRLRYEEKKAEQGFGRFTPKETHDEAYAGIPQTLERVDQKKSVERLTIYDMNLKPVYDNHLKDGEWVNPPLSRQALENERDRALSPTEIQKFNQDYDKIFLLMDARNADKQEVAEAQSSRAKAGKQLEA